MGFLELIKVESKNRKLVYDSCLVWFLKYLNLEENFNTYLNLLNEFKEKLNKNKITKKQLDQIVNDLKDITNQEKLELASFVCLTPHGTTKFTKKEFKKVLGDRLTDYLNSSEMGMDFKKWEKIVDNAFLEKTLNFFTSENILEKRDNNYILTDFGKKIKKSVESHWQTMHL